MRGEIIHFEQKYNERKEKLRVEALRTFPWSKVEYFRNEAVEPLLRSLSDQKRIILLEMIYRLIFEAYAFGIVESKKALSLKRGLSQEVGWDTVYLHFYKKQGELLIQATIHDFAIFYWLEEWNSQSFYFLFEDILQSWFIEGVQVGLKLNIR
ncbi:hypothetical protein [Thermoflavimicrobium dichotomicum]|uniref:Uncharacterized protein n=1 Tax=Thermoflavimicrobium dichotomicum TaxID=46223 RepID=A0A1I3QXR3_9BACL|nr:hypothetical protein [Thermoflavimicrobium dichotomicum]SFJ38868.1 hypothetical protein SAMN05421852_108163 [Thermoflavimicrobium dichotomicum]